jgi:hypothetical protein
VEKDRRLEGWRVRGLAKNREEKGSRSQGFKDSSEKGRRLEGWRVRGVAKNPINKRNQAED